MKNVKRKWETKKSSKTKWGREAATQQFIRLTKKRTQMGMATRREIGLTLTAAQNSAIQESQDSQANSYKVILKQTQLC